MAYVFSRDLETGNIQIDSQHKELINAINELLDACSQGNGRAQLKKTADFLLSYTKRHFADEEALQAKINYVDIINHKRYHAEFVKAVTQLVAELDAQGATIVMVGKINNTVASWLIKHIKTEDVKVAQAVKAAK